MWYYCTDTRIDKMEKLDTIKYWQEFEVIQSLASHLLQSKLIPFL